MVIGTDAERCALGCPRSELFDVILMGSVNEVLQHVAWTSDSSVKPLTAADETSVRQ